MNPRNLTIVLDYAYGVADVEAIAAREGISTQRVYQVLNRAAASIGKHTTFLKHNPDKAKTLLQNTWSRGVYVGRQAETPEEFFYEVMQEPKTRDFSPPPNPPLTREDLVRDGFRNFSRLWGVDLLGGGGM